MLGREHEHEAERDDIDAARELEPAARFLRQFRLTERVYGNPHHQRVIEYASKVVEQQVDVIDHRFQTVTHQNLRIERGQESRR